MPLSISKTFWTGVTSTFDLILIAEATVAPRASVNNFIVLGVKDWSIRLVLKT